MDRLRHTNEHLDREAFSGAVEPLLQARCIYVLGVRSSAALASSLSYYLHYMFENVRLITTPSTARCFEQLVRISPQDAVIGISFPRYSTATGKALQYCREAGAQVIALTDSETAPIARSAHYLLTAKSDMVSLVDSLGSAPMSVVNALIVALTSRRKHELRRRSSVWSRSGISTMSMKKSTFDAVIVGGGAAGLFAAVQASARGRRILLLKKTAAAAKSSSSPARAAAMSQMPAPPKRR